jgi:aldehyde dehydrogenase (NAD+)
MELDKFYIGGEWVSPHSASSFELIDPATEEKIGALTMGDEDDVGRAVEAAAAAFPAFSTTTPQDRAATLSRIIEAFERRKEELAQATRLEMGCPITHSRTRQVPRGPSHLQEYVNILGEFEFEQRHGTTRIRLEPVGVSGLITPWNWPINQVMVKFAPAFAAGCTMILKPSEYSSISAVLFAEVLEEAGVAPGVFNLVLGSGPQVGSAISRHPDVDAVSFTGSTVAGVQVAIDAAPTVKRVAQELGGKSPNIILSDAPLESSVRRAVEVCFGNAGQSCAAPTRLLVPVDRIKDVCDIACATAEGIRVGSPDDEATELGPVANRNQFERVQGFIEQGEREGARLVTGGPGRPKGLNRGFFVRPTVFADVAPSMVIAQKEIFGPVLSIITYRDDDEAVQIANGTSYGLGAHIQSADIERARRLAARIVAGAVYLNYPPFDFGAPFGGRKQSGNGREWGEYGLREFLEVKSVIGYEAAPV